jgi:hypothetical protein
MSSATDGMMILAVFLRLPYMIFVRLCGWLDNGMQQHLAGLDGT